MWQKRFEELRDKQFTVVGIALDSEGVQPAKTYYEKYGVTFPALVDPNYATTFTAVPKTIFVDEHGVVQPLDDWRDALDMPAKDVPEALAELWTDPEARLGAAAVAELVKAFEEKPRDLAIAVDLASRYADLSLHQEATAILRPLVEGFDVKSVARATDRAPARLLSQAYFQLARGATGNRDQQVKDATLAFFLNPSIGFGKQIARIIAPEKFDGRPKGDFDNSFREGTLRRLRRERREWLEAP